ncbi:MAG TPA: toxin TcdB middle/N-terminal domain-containing protein, partial [Ilumatobacteraceae bacterium]
MHVNQGDGSFELVDMGLDAVGASFVEDRLQLADMNGDGLQDLVRKATDLVAYRTNLGFGRWSDWIELAGVPGDLAGDEQLVDLNGDSLADLVAVRADAVLYAVNRDGTSFAERVELAASEELPIPGRTSDISVRFADLNGSGSTDIVWINSSGAVTYLELFPERPNLLTRIDNAIGKVIEIDYGSSTDHLRRDGGDWELRLPNPMLTVDEIVVRDELSGIEQRQSIEYRNGYYDGGEKQFRGFSHVEVATPGDDSVDPGLRTLEYDVGLEDAYRKALLLREKQASPGRELSETEHSYDACALSGVEETTPPVRFVCPRAVVITKKEGRPEAEWVTIEERFEYDGYGNRTLTEKLGVTAVGGGGCPACADDAEFGAPCDRSCRGDERYESSEFITPTAGRPWILGKPRVTRQSADANGEVARERVYRYDGSAFEGLPEGELELGMVSRVRARAATQGDEWVDVERYERDAHGAVVESLDPDGRRREFAYDTESILLTSERVFLGEAEESYTLTMNVEYDPALDLVIEASSWVRSVGDEHGEGRQSRYAYDPFGRLTAIARPGDTLDAPSEVYTYAVAAPVSRIVKRARSERGGDLDLEEVQCFDGLGRSLQKRTLIDAGRYEISGFSVFNGGGSVFREYQTYAGESGACDEAPPAGVDATESLYDATGRVLRAIQPDTRLYGSASVVDTEYFPLHTVVRDEEDTRSGSGALHENTPDVTHVDGLGRTVAIERYPAPDETLRTTFAYDGLGELSGYVDAQGNRKRQERDLLGRVVRVEDPDSGVTLFQYDGAGHIVARTDARDMTVRISYDGAGRKLAEWQDGDKEATRIDYAYDAAEDCAPCSNAAGLLVRVSYPLADDRSERGVDEFGYDERSQPAYLARTLGGTRFEFRTEFDNNGRITRSRYPGGLSVPFTYDRAGKLTSAGDYVPEVVYDDRGLVSALSLGNEARTTYGYDPLDRLSALDTVLPNEETLQAARFERDRAGNVLSVIDESVPPNEASVNARYRYDSLYRLVEARLDPDRDHEELVEFGYDEIDNIVSKTSNRGDSPDHVGGYRYGQNGAGPHAVTKAGRVELSYGPAGHLDERDGNR